MIAKVVLGTMQNARKLVSIVEAIPYDAELCAGRYVVNAKSMLGVLSMPDGKQILEQPRSVLMYLCQ